MGKLVKSRLARLMMSAALLDLFWSALYIPFHCYRSSLMIDGDIHIPQRWTKAQKVSGTTPLELFNGRYTHIAVAPVPILQIVNTIIGGLGMVNEFSTWCNRFLSKHHFRLFQNIPLRCVVYILAVGPAVVQFQTSQAVPYIIIGTVMYLWGFFEGERLDENGLGIRKPIPSRINVQV